MVSLTRRRALHGLAAIAATLAGCNGSDSDSFSDPPPAGPPENVVKDPPHYTLRNPEPEPPVLIQPPETTTDGMGGSRRPRRDGLVATAETADRITFVDGLDGADAARKFVEATDFSSETLLLEPRTIDECFHNKLCYVTWSSFEYRTWYARLYRDADVACETDANDFVTFLIRIPDTLDPQNYNSHGSGTSTRGCMVPPGLRRRREQADDAENTTTTTSTTATNTTSAARDATATSDTPDATATDVTSNAGDGR